MSLPQLAVGDSRRVLEAQARKKEETKAEYLEQRKMLEATKREAAARREQKWQSKLARSPFHVDLVAEQERVDEENRIRLREEARRQRMVERRKEEVKNEIILKALAEASDLEALRAEKRAIAAEEKRLKALLEMERAKAARKADRQAAMRAEKQRQAAKGEYRREKFAEFKRERDEEEKMILMEKHMLKPTKGLDQFEDPEDDPR